ncbi:MAG: galactose-1-phosphate uridylyltransferase [Candidatus Dormibacteria bacterium]
MPELRRDPVTGRWVCLAPDRALRPESMRARTLETDDSNGCPFCAGHEALTPPEVDVVREHGEANDANWLVRAVPNLFPPFSENDAPTDLGLLGRGPALGVCEVIIHSPDHQRWLPHLSAEQAARIFELSHRRYRRHAVRGAGNVVLFYNHGREAGASLGHPHGQLFSTRLSSPILDEEVAGAEDAYRHGRRCVFCATMEEELRRNERVVSVSDDFVALAPWASRTAFECVVMPRVHHADFGHVSEETAGRLGEFMRDLLWRMEQELGDVALSWYLHSLASAAGEATLSYHWHVAVLPRVQDAGGFELATGTQVNTVLPEVAAEALRTHGAPPPESTPPRAR